MVNAREGYIYQRKNELEREGYFITPIYASTCYYNYDLRLPEVRKKFEVEMRENLSADYVRKIKSIYTKNDRIKTEEFLGYVRAAEEKYGEKAADTLKHYGLRWGIM